MRNIEAKKKNHGCLLGELTMARLIDAKAGKKVFSAIAQPAEYKGVIHMVVPISEIDKLPTVDAVEVVRCKDCQKCLIDNSKRELHLCMKRPSFPVRVKLDGFCSDGERKDGDGNG